MSTKRMHCQDKLLMDLEWAKRGYCNTYQSLAERWDDGYSTSRHLIVLAEIAIGLDAKKMGEIGVGRSTFVLNRVSDVLGAQFMCCDRYDYHYMFEKAGMIQNYLLGDAKDFYKHHMNRGLDFLFLDYMSTRKMSAKDCYRDFKKALNLMKTNAIIAVHDSYAPKYNVSDGLELLKDKYKNRIEILTLPYNNGLGLIRNKMKSKYGKILDKWKKKNDTTIL